MGINEAIKLLWEMRSNCLKSNKEYNDPKAVEKAQAIELIVRSYLKDKVELDTFFTAIKHFSTEDFSKEVNEFIDKYILDKIEGE